MASIDTLFRPFDLKGLTLPNRVVMAPMTRSFSPGGVATEDVAAYYRRRAENQVGLIISEGTGVARPASLNDPDIPRFHGEAELNAWKTVIDQVHAVGGLMAPQLWHVGAVRSRSKDWTPLRQPLRPLQPRQEVWRGDDRRRGRGRHLSVR
jgi:2,4-dienoyl-CoA reductase-like NADH-dependent reductase (Old Yellow Enzyme family)